MTRSTLSSANELDHDSINRDDTNVVPRRQICGVPVDAVSWEQLLALFRQHSLPGSPASYVCYLNAHVHNLARRHAALRAILQDATCVYPDGSGIVWAGRVLDQPVSTRLTAADFLPAVLTQMHELQRRVFFLGGRPTVARRCAHAMAELIPGFQLVGDHDGYFDRSQQERVLCEIRESNPDLLLVGMGTPRQEFWVRENLRHLRIPLTWVVGALFDYAAGEEQRCPNWMGDYGLEWLFRFCMRPRRMAGRYLIGNPTFVSVVMAERLRKSLRQA